MATRLTRDEQRERTREQLVEAAERRFIDHGFHATSVDQIAAEAGYTKGAVYSNFESKEDLFFAVYERRAAQAVRYAERTLASEGGAAGLERLVSDSLRRRGREDGWLAVFFEFWAHVIRHPELRRRFASIHDRTGQPMVEATRRLARERGLELPVDPASFSRAFNAMQLGLILERLTQPQAIEVTLAARMIRFGLGGAVGGGSERDEEEGP